MEEPVTSSKRDERAKARGILSSIDNNNRSRQSEQIEKELTSWLTQREVVSLLVTLPLTDEPDLTAFFRRWLESGRAVALAREEPGDGLSFRLVTQWKAQWSGTVAAVRQGPAEAPRWRPSARAICLVPGLAFAHRSDCGFDRLGRGGGFFDRWLAQKPTGLVTMGVGFQEQLWDRITVESHDQSVDVLLTADGVQT